MSQTATHHPLFGFMGSLPPVEAIFVGPRRDKTLLGRKATDPKLFAAAAKAELVRILERDLRWPGAPSNSFIRRAFKLANYAGVKLADVIREVQGPAVLAKAKAVYGEPVVKKDGRVERRSDGQYIGDVGKEGKTWAAATPEPSSVEQDGFSTRAEAADWLLVMSVIPAGGES